MRRIRSGSAPRILLVDEPSVGLAPVLVSRTIDKIKELKDRYQLTVLMAEQNFPQALRIADRGYIIVHGEIAVAAGSVDELKAMFSSGPSEGNARRLAGDIAGDIGGKRRRCCGSAGGSREIGERIPAQREEIEVYPLGQTKALPVDRRACGSGG